jgi:hypothetical protein
VEDEGRIVAEEARRVGAPRQRFAAVGGMPPNEGGRLVVVPP